MVFSRSCFKLIPFSGQKYLVCYIQCIYLLETCLYIVLLPDYFSSVTVICVHRLLDWVRIIFCVNIWLLPQQKLNVFILYLELQRDVCIQKDTGFLLALPFNRDIRISSMIFGQIFCN